MEIILGQPAKLRYRLVDEIGVPVNAQLVDTECYYAKGNATMFTRFDMKPGTGRILGPGWYEAWFTATETDALGPLSSQLVCLGAVTSVREDVVVAATVVSSGVLVTFSALIPGPVPIVDCHVQVRNAGGTVILAQGLTDSVGAYAVMLDAGTYLVYAWKPGYSFAAFPQTVVVTVAASVTLAGTVYSPYNPGGPAVTTVTGWLLDATGTARVGVAISFTPILEDEAGVSEKETLRPLASISTNKLIARVQIVATTDAAGAFTVSLTPNSDITPAGSRYLVTFSDSVLDHARITVPASGPVNINTLLAAT
jgi:hypothetical protein